jgi:hypothetical protein
MLETHVTKDGSMISLVVRKAREVKAMADNASGLDAYHQQLYGIKQVSQEDAAQVTRMALRKLYPYLAEAYLRGLDGPRQELVEFLGRETSLAADIPLLDAPELPEDDDDMDW